MQTIITHGASEDNKYTIFQIGRRIVITTDSIPVARNIMRRLIENLTEEDEETNAIGFDTVE